MTSLWALDQLAPYISNDEYSTVFRAALLEGLTGLPTISFLLAIPI